MKKIICMMIGTLVSVVAVQAQDLSEGRQELGLSGNLSLDEPDPVDYQLNLDVKYGYFLMDYIQVGANVGINANGEAYTFEIGPFAEYNLDMGSELVPFVGLGLHFATAEVDVNTPSSVNEAGEIIDGSVETIDNSGVVFNGEAGVKYFLSDSVAATASFDFSWSTDDVFNGEDSAENINIGMRAYF